MIHFICAETFSQIKKNASAPGTFYYYYLESENVHGKCKQSTIMNLLCCLKEF